MPDDLEFENKRTSFFICKKHKMNQQLFRMKNKDV